MHPVVSPALAAKWLPGAPESAPPPAQVSETMPGYVVGWPEYADMYATVMEGRTEHARERERRRLEERDLEDDDRMPELESFKRDGDAMPELGD